MYYKLTLEIDLSLWKLLVIRVAKKKFTCMHEHVNSLEKINKVSK